MNEMKPEDVMRENDWLVRGVSKEQLSAEREQALREGYEALLREKDAEIERLIKERNEARRNVAVAERNHYDSEKSQVASEMKGDKSES